MRQEALITKAESELAARIRESTGTSLNNRDDYSEDQVAEWLGLLQKSRAEVAKILGRYSSLGNVVSTVRQGNVENVLAEIDGVMGDLKRGSTLARRAGVKQAWKNGIEHSLDDLWKAGFPSYAELTEAKKKQTASAAFNLMDTHALDFLVNYNVQLAGNVTQELRDGIRGVVFNGITQGLSVPEMVQQMGTIIKDPEEFRKAGSKVYKTAQLRAQTIARTETMRAHNQGRIKFYDTAGFAELEWLAIGDERQCPVCEALNGKRFPPGKFPPMPAHPLCRCTQVAIEPLNICPDQPAAKAASGSSCVLSPNQIIAQDKAKKDEAKQVSEMVDGGNYDGMTVKQLKQYVQDNKMPWYMTKPDYIAKLNALDPAVDHGSLSPDALKAKIAQFKIPNVKTKQELIDMIKASQALKQQVTKKAFEAAQTPVPQVQTPDFGAMSFQELVEETKKHKIPISKTKEHFVKELDELEPGTDHSYLKGDALKAKIKEHGLKQTKPKEMLVDELKAVYKGKAPQQDFSQQEAINKVAKVKAGLSNTLGGIPVPTTDSPQHVFAFKEGIAQAFKDIEAAKGSLVEADYHFYLTELLKKQAQVAETIQNMPSSAMNKFQNAAGMPFYQWTSKGEFITIVTSIDQEAVGKAEQAILTKWESYVQKHGGPKQKADLKSIKDTGAFPYPKVEKAPPLPASETATVSQVVAVPPPEEKPKKKPVKAPQKLDVPEIPPTPTKLAPSDHGATDAAWEVKAKALRFTYQEQAAIGGMHTKHFYTDEHGERWLFKPYSEEFRVQGDEVAYKISRLIDPNAIEARTVELNIPGKGKVRGSIQPWQKGLASETDFSRVAPSNLKKADLDQVQREHVIDWLLSNHDGHSENFLRYADGRVAGIDKGQLFKFFPGDKIDPDYNPNPIPSYYNKIMGEVRAGNMKIDPRATLEAIRKVELIGDEDYKALLRPYAEARFTKKADREVFYNRALNRKNRIREDFEGLYKDVMGDPQFSFAAFEQAGQKKAVEKAIETKTAGRITKEVAKELEAAKKNGFQGKALKIDYDQIEDQNILIFEQKGRDGKPQTTLQFKLLPESERGILKALGDNASGKTAAKVSVEVPRTLKGQPPKEDEFYDDILLAIKSANHHISSGNPGGANQAKLDKAKSHIAKLNEYFKSHPDDDVKEMAVKYYNAIKSIEKGLQDGTPIPPFQQYVRERDEPIVVPKGAKKKPAPAKDEDSYTLGEGAVSFQLRQLKDKSLAVTKESVGLDDMTDNYIHNKGHEYRAEFPDGMVVKVRPSTDKNLRAIQGSVEVVVPGGVDPERMERVLARLEKMGVNANFASPVQQEVMYLQKMAYVNKYHAEDPEYRTMINGLKNRGDSPEQWRTSLVEYWNKKLGVKDVTKLGSYNPDGIHEFSIAEGKTNAGGYRHQYRFDLDAKTVHKEMKGHTLTHSLYGGDYAEFLDLALGSNGTMISTVEKLRYGIKMRGMSPERDLETGGANYFFTRIRKRSDVQGSVLCFKPTMLRRMDAISYASDEFGDTRGNAVTQKRHSAPKDWKDTCARRSSNETIFKGTVTILDNLDAVKVDSTYQRDKVLQVFKKHGITHVPDGRRIEDVVVLELSKEAPAPQGEV